MDWKDDRVSNNEEVSKNLEIKFKTLKEVRDDRGIKILSYGNYSTGKTHFSLTGDEPTFIIDTENGSAPLANKFPNVKVLNIANTDSNEVEEKDEVKNYENFVDVVNYLCSLPDDEVKTIVIDSISDIWEWCQAYAKIKIFKLSIEDRLKAQFDWGVINRLYKSQIMKLINKKCNLVLCARESEIYDGAKPSGRYQPKCQKLTPFWVDIVLYHEVKFLNKKIYFQAKVVKYRQKGDVVGRIIGDPTISKIKGLIENE